MPTRPEITGRAIGVEAYNVKEFCKAHGISRSQFYVLRKKGLGPDEMRLLGRVLISRESASRWRKKHTIRPPAEAAE
jgi:hypothetical protein